LNFAIGGLRFEEIFLTLGRLRVGRGIWGAQNAT